jgi:hypothetical protein
MVRLAVRILRTPAETSAPGGVTANAVHVMRLATEEIEEVRTEDGKSAAAVAFGRKAGLARARTLNRESRLTIARKVPRVDGRDRSRRVCSGSRSRFARRASAYVRHDTKVQRRHVEDEAPSRAIALGVVHGRVDQHAGVYAVRPRSVEFTTRSSTQSDPHASTCRVDGTRSRMGLQQPSRLARDYYPSPRPESRHRAAEAAFRLGRQRSCREGVGRSDQSAPPR